MIHCEDGAAWPRCKHAWLEERLVIADEIDGAVLRGRPRRRVEHLLIDLRRLAELTQGDRPRRELELAPEVCGALLLQFSQRLNRGGPSGGPADKDEFLVAATEGGRECGSSFMVTHDSTGAQDAAFS